AGAADEAADAGEAARDAGGAGGEVDCDVGGECAVVEDFRAAAAGNGAAEAAAGQEYEVVLHRTADHAGDTGEGDAVDSTGVGPGHPPIVRHGGADERIGAEADDGRGWIDVGQVVGVDAGAAGQRLRANAAPDLHRHADARGVHQVVAVVDVDVVAADVGGR